MACTQSPTHENNIWCSAPNPKTESKRTDRAFSNSRINNLINKSIIIIAELLEIFMMSWISFVFWNSHWLDLDSWYYKIEVRTSPRDISNQQWSSKFSFTFILLLLLFFFLISLGKIEEHHLWFPWKRAVTLFLSCRRKFIKIDNWGETNSIRKTNKFPVPKVQWLVPTQATDPLIMIFIFIGYIS